MSEQRERKIDMSDDEMKKIIADLKKAPLGSKKMSKEINNFTIMEQLENLRDKLYKGDTEAPHTYMQRLGNELNEIIKDLIEQSSNKDKKQRERG